MGLVWYNHQYHSYGYPFMTTPSGLSYKSIGRQGNGKKVKDGEWVELALLMKVVPKKITEANPSSAQEAGEAKPSSAQEAGEAKSSSAQEAGEAKSSSAKEAGEANPSSAQEAGEAKSSSAKEAGEAKPNSAKEAEKGKQRSTDERVLLNIQQPVLYQFDQSFQSNNKQIAEMIGMMEAKQRMVFKCNPGYYLEEKDPERLEQILKALDLHKEDEIVIDIKLGRIMTDQAYKDMLEERCATQLAKDKKLITDYLAAHHIEASSTDSGLYYIIDQPSREMAVDKGKMVTVHYTGRLLDGTMFDTSIEEVAKANNLYNPRRPYRPLTFQVGIGQVIKGWDEGLLLLKKHEKARFFIPSALAYGLDARGDVIPANAILLFEVEVVDVCEPSESKPKQSASDESKSK
ncbi:FKBP-type peptidyl-prolyl cis-trans isomerase [Cardinium endosymbiont of Dermatophagoides farinae]|uniref:FKBP-type peptidyl-prolyl cis-trans isomerase n=1 Tax=Cardinium endosymbiont of Dermatophagoides farinae TaxID=2597823 RepID=UPI001CB8BA67|nr:FKBP-type peptidyl-prolyl cis-trans isomerase [Cardinium endosymbiont of Dermatophagoides farinae]